MIIFVCLQAQARTKSVQRLELKFCRPFKRLTDNQIMSTTGTREVEFQTPRIVGESLECCCSKDMLVERRLPNLLPLLDRIVRPDVSPVISHDQAPQIIV